MWKKLAKIILVFFQENQEWFEPFICALTGLLAFFIMVYLCYLYDEYGSLFEARRIKVLRRNKVLIERLSGKKPCRKLKLRKKLLTWRKSHLQKSLELVNLKLENTNKILEKFSYE